MDRGEMDRRERRALLASAATLVALAVLQAPGRIVPETKLDVVLDPATFLARALHAWDPSAGFGRLQNQAVGYLFPMGPFHLLGRSLGLAPWLVQRLWIGAVLAMALWGAHRVARAVGIGSAGGRLAAAWAYALAPATLGMVAFQSAGQLPYALAPHVLAPLLTARPDGSPRRVAARSALWVAAMGGVNGASAFAVLPLVAIWFATRTPGPDRRRLLAWWSGGAVAATLWWFVPLVVAVRYGVRFTDYTEQSSLTTVTASAGEVLRGTDNWLGYLSSPVGPWLPGAWEMAVSRLAIAGSVAVAAAGLVGLCRRDLPERTWLIASAALGAVAIGVGYAGPWAGAGSGLARELLDGPLVVFRNVHKFAAVLRLPIALGVGHLVVAASRSIPRRIPAPVPLAAALAAVVLAVAPALPQLTAPGSFDDVPDHWRQAAAFLEEADSTGALVLPGAAFGEYRWGRPLDEPLNALGVERWAARDLIPLGGNGSTRVLDAIDDAFVRGVAPPGLVPVLQRAGISHLVVRNDLDLQRTGGPRPATVREVLRRAPGLELVASFGEPGPDRGADGQLASPPGAAGAEAYRAVDIWEVSGPTPLLSTHPVAGTLALTGGPEALLWLPAELLDGRATVLDVDDAGALGAEVVVIGSDTARRRDVAFGAIRGNVTRTLDAAELSPATGREPVDRWPADEPRGLVVATLDGAAALSDSTEPPGIHPPDLQPYAAFDGNPATVWSAGAGAEGEWLEVAFDAPRSVPELIATLPRLDGRRVAAVEVHTDGGTVSARFDRSGQLRARLPEAPTERVRIEVTDVAGTAVVGPVGLAEIELEGVTITRPLLLATPDAGPVAAVSLLRARPDPMTATRAPEDGRFDRRFPWGGGEATLTGTAVAVPGPGLDRLLERARPDLGPAEGRAVVVDASSTFRRQPAFAPSAAFDGDRLTAWVSAREAGTPTLSLRWDGPVLVDALAIEVLEVPGAGIDQVEEVDITVGGRTHRRAIGIDGTVTVPTAFTDAIELGFPGDDGEDPARGRRVAIAEVEVPGLAGRAVVGPQGAAPERTAAVELPCGEGPHVAVDGELVATRASTTVGALLDADPIIWEACSPLALSAGEHRIEADGPSPALTADTALLLPADGIKPPAAARALSDLRWLDHERRAVVAPGDAAILATAENRNEGWEATLDGEPLDAVRVDGWRQGWLVPAGAGGELVLRYAPDRVHRGGVALGGLLVLGLVAAAVVPTRRSGWGPPSARRTPGWLGIVLAGLVAVALLQPIAIALVGLGGLLARRLAGPFDPDRSERTIAAIAAAGAVGAGALAMAAPLGGIGGIGGTFSGPAQLLGAVALIATTASLALSPAVGSTPSTRARSDRQPPDSGTTLEGSG